MPALSARSDEAWIAGPSAIGSVNGMPISIRSAPAAGRPREERERGVGIGIAGGDEGDEPAAPGRLQRGEAARDAPGVGGALDRAHSLVPSASATVKMSLSPRPHRFITMRWSFGSVGASFDDLGERVRRLERRDDALEARAAAGRPSSASSSVAET